MWSDDGLKRGRRIKWKYIILLLLLAMASLLGAMASEQIKEDIAARLKGIWDVSVDWKTFSASPASAAVSLEDGFAIVSGGKVMASDRQGNILYTLETNAEELILADGAVAYAPGGRVVYRLKQDGWSELSVSGEVIYVAAGKEKLAVITAASGFLTKTWIYDQTGGLLGTIGRPEEAMITVALLSKDILLCLCLNQMGRWSLQYYDTSGNELEKVVLEGAGCRLSAWDGGAAVLTDASLLFFDSNGIETGRYDLSGVRPEGWCCAEAGWAALWFRSGSQNVIRTVSPSGTVLGETVVPELLRSVAVCGSTLYVLDMQALRVYDRQCDQKMASADGARSSTLLPFDYGCWLFGNGEIKKLVIS